MLNIIKFVPFVFSISSFLYTSLYFNKYKNINNNPYAWYEILLIGISLSAFFINKFFYKYYKKSQSNLLNSENEN